MSAAAGLHSTNHHLALQPAARIRGRVVFEGSGEPAIGYGVLLVVASNARTHLPQYTDENGNFAFDRLDAAGYCLFAGQSVASAIADGVLYPGQACRINQISPQNHCNLAAATLLTPSAGGVVDGIVVTVPRDRSIFADGFNGSLGH